jgi:hypothetical protein
LITSYSCAGVRIDATLPWIGNMFTAWVLAASTRVVRWEDDWMTARSPRKGDLLTWGLGAWIWSPWIAWRGSTAGSSNKHAEHTSYSQIWRIRE